MEKDKGNDKQKNEKTKSIRKSRSGLPQVNMLDAINYIKKAYESIGTDLTSFSGLAKAMGMDKAYAIKAFGELSTSYGLIEKEGNGWKISDLGRRVAKGEKNATLEVLGKSQILFKLYAELKDRRYQKDYVEDFIRREFPRINISLVAQRYSEVVEYINSLGEEGNKENNVGRVATNSKLFFNIFKLHYALSPANKEEIKSLVDEVSKEIAETKDETLISLSDRMVKNKNNDLVLREFFESLIEIMSKKYPGFSIKIEDKKKEISQK